STGPAMSREGMMNTAAATRHHEMRDHHLFMALTEDQYDAVLARAQTRTFAARQRIFNQGDHARSFFLVQQGTVKLYRVSALGQEKIMRLVTTGDSFAESVMFMDEPRYPVDAEG